MNKQLEQTKQFMKAFGQDIQSEPTLIDFEVARLRMNLIDEELRELLQAVLDNNLTEVADALVDLQYVLNGTVLAFGMQDIFDEMYDEVHRSNMSKLGPDGKPIYREDGKILKGPKYSKPNLIPILEKVKNQFKLDFTDYPSLSQFPKTK